MQIPEVQVGNIEALSQSNDKIENYKVCLYTRLNENLGH